MTRASRDRRERLLRRRKRGRPKDRGLDPAEQFKLELVSALQAAWQLSERKALDLVVAMSEAKLMPPSSFELPLATIAGRAATLRQKRKRAPPDEATTALMALALRCADLESALRLFRSLLDLALRDGPEAARQVVARMLAR
jgi:hypothetical protein